MNFLNKLKKIKEISKPSYLFKSLLYFSGRYIRVFTFLTALAAVGFCVYLWYGTIYRPQWSESQKNAYMKDKSQGTVFNEKGFEYDTAAAKDREEESQKNLDGLTDIFHLNKNVAADVPTVSTAPATPAKTILGTTTTDQTVVAH